MNIAALGQELRKMYEDGEKRNEKVAMIHLFAIKFSDEIKNQDRTINNTLEEILKYAELRPSYKVELNKGMNIAKYVRVIE